MQRPKVSISIITYNHENYISRAIDSALMQEVDFDFEIIIGDDSSSDRTPEIIKEYKKKHPDKIHLILHPERYMGVPGRLNNITNLYACRGKYVALLDGDDYWLDPGKLQRQVDFLDKNDDYAVVAHDAVKVSPEDNFDMGSYSADHPKLKVENTFTQEDVLHAAWCITQTSTVVYRNGLFDEFPEWFWSIISADFALLILLSQHGKIKYFKGALGAYQIHENSFMSKHFYSKDSIEQKVAELRFFRRTYFPYKFDSSFFQNLQLSSNLNRRIAWNKMNYTSRLIDEKSFFKSLGYFVKNSLSNFSIIYLIMGAFQRYRRSSSVQ